MYVIRRSLIFDSIVSCQIVFSNIFVAFQQMNWLKSNALSWEQRKLGELSQRVIVGLATSVTPYYQDAGVPILRNLNIKENYLDDSDILHLDEDYARSQTGKQIHTGDVLTVHTGYIGTSCIVPEKYDNCLTFTTLVTTTDASKLNGEFLAQYLNSNAGMSAAQMVTTQGGRQNLNTNDFVKVEIPYPSVAEQEKICDLLGSLDNLITLHQRKYEKLQIIKKSMLENCFPKNGEKVPRIRFAGFTGDWEQRKLADVAEIIGGGTPSTSNPDYWDGDIDWYAPAEIGDQIFAHESVRKITKEGLIHSSAKILPAHKTVLFTSRAGIGNMAILKRPAATNQGFQSLVCHDDIDPYFMFSMGDSIKAKAERVAAGSTFAEISGKKLGDLEFMFPRTNEQKAIGGYFKNLDSLITLHQSKAESWKNKKNRFLTMSWEQRKVGELLSERIEQFPKSDEYPLMAFVANEGVAPKGDRYDRSALVNDTEGKLYKRTEFGDFIYSSNNLETGSIGLNKYGNATISPVYSIFRPTEIADSDFIGRRFVRKDFINEMVKWRQGVIYGQWKIHEEDFLKIEVMVPSLEEQRRIGSFLDNLNHLITLHQGKLERI